MDSALWFRHPQRVWALGDIRQGFGKEAEVKERGGSGVFRVNLAETHPCDPSHLDETTSDVTAVNNMHEAPLLNLLERRFAREQIYTSAGDGVLLSVNPYRKIPGLYEINRLAALAKAHSRATLRPPSAGGVSASASSLPPISVPKEEEGKEAAAQGETGLPSLTEMRLPHVFAVAERAYKGLMESMPRRNQAVVISGESGAGKTEAAKKVLSYLGLLSLQHLHNSKARKSIVARSTAVETRVTSTNPVLEAFGNAKTGRNDNSSRFGKLLLIQYGDGSSAGRILGARMRHYLLEKGRVVSAGVGERNYHIFYQLCRAAQASAALATGPASPAKAPAVTFGANAMLSQEDLDEDEEEDVSRPAFSREELEKLRLLPPEKFGYLVSSGDPVAVPQGYDHITGGSAAGGSAPNLTGALSEKALECTRVNEVDDAFDFKGVVKALSLVGVDKTTQQAIWRVLSAVLWLGNIRFHEPNGKEEAAIVPDPDQRYMPVPFCSFPTPSSSKGEKLTSGRDVVSTAALNAADLLGVPGLPSKLLRRLVRVKGRGSVYEVNLTARQAQVARDSLAKAIYERLFTWVILQCNHKLSASSSSLPALAPFSPIAGGPPRAAEHLRTDSSSSLVKPSSFIGILDIFGFEIFQRNSFEQLCINYCNEKLQCLFNEHVFVLEQETYRAEGVKVEEISFLNNQGCVDLIEKKPLGLLPILDEVCILARENTTDSEFLERIERAHKGKHPNYGGPAKKRTEDGQFSILHFAGAVSYSVDGFIEKNSDRLHADLSELMNTSSAPLVPDLFSPALMNAEIEEDAAMDIGTGAAATGAATTTATSAMVPAARPGHMPHAGGAVAASGTSSSTAIATIASRFKQSLAVLHSTLLATSPHYIRCIKPNSLKAAGVFDHPLVLAQLLYSGVLETVRIRRQGFPFREAYHEFWRRATNNRFAVLLPPAVREQLPPSPPPPQWVDSGSGGPLVDASLTTELVDHSKKAVVILLQNLLRPDQWTLGTTKVFLKDGAVNGIVLSFRRFHALKILRWWRAARIHRRYRRFRHAVNVIKRRYKGFLLRQRFAAVTHQICVFQANVRRRIAVKRYNRELIRRQKAEARRKAFLSTVLYRVRFLRYRKIKAAERREQERQAAILRARQKAATRIQAAWRGWVARKRFKVVRSGVAKLKRHWKHQRVIALARKRVHSCVLLQRCFKSFISRIRLRRFLRAVWRIQAWVRGSRVRRAFVKLMTARARLSRAVLSHLRRKALIAWVQDAFAAAAWGDETEMRVLLSPSLAQGLPIRYHRLEECSAWSRVNIRNRDDGLKSLLHAAIASGNPGCISLLVSTGADIAARDITGSSPLHRAAFVGDSHLAMVKSLHALAQGLVVNSAVVRTGKGRPTLQKLPPLPPVAEGDDSSLSSAGRGHRRHSSILAARAFARQSVSEQKVERIKRASMARVAMKRGTLLPLAELDEDDDSKERKGAGAGGLQAIAAGAIAFGKGLNESLLAAEAAGALVRDQFVNAVNKRGETALDVAVRAWHATDGSLGGIARRDHAATIQWLLEAGGHTIVSMPGGKEGFSRAAVEALLKQPRGNELFAAAAASREHEILAKRAAERRADPHYAFLFMERPATTMTTARSTGNNSSPPSARPGAGAGAGPGAGAGAGPGAGAGAGAGAVGLTHSPPTAASNGAAAMPFQQQQQQHQPPMQRLPLVTPSSAVAAAGVPHLFKGNDRDDASSASTAFGYSQATATAMATERSVASPRVPGTSDAASASASASAAATLFSPVLGLPLSSLTVPLGTGTRSTAGGATSLFIPVEKGMSASVVMPLSSLMEKDDAYSRLYAASARSVSFTAPAGPVPSVPLPLSAGPSADKPLSLSKQQQQAPVSSAKPPTSSRASPVSTQPAAPIAIARDSSTAGLQALFDDLALGFESTLDAALSAGTKSARSSPPPRDRDASTAANNGSSPAGSARSTAAIDRLAEATKKEQASGRSPDRIVPSSPSPINKPVTSACAEERVEDEKGKREVAAFAPRTVAPPRSSQVVAVAPQSSPYREAGALLFGDGSDAMAGVRELPPADALYRQHLQPHGLVLGSASGKLPRKTPAPSAHFEFVSSADVEAEAYADPLSGLALPAPPVPPPLPMPSVRASIGSDDALSGPGVSGYLAPLPLPPSAGVPAFSLPSSSSMAPAPASSSASSSSSSAWRVEQSASTGLLYYFNPTTGATQWEEPADLNGAASYLPWHLEVLKRVQTIRTLAVGGDISRLYQDLSGSYPQAARQLLASEARSSMNAGAVGGDGASSAARTTTPRKGDDPALTVRLTPGHHAANAYAPSVGAGTSRSNSNSNSSSSVLLQGRTTASLASNSIRGFEGIREAAAAAAGPRPSLHYADIGTSRPPSARLQYATSTTTTMPSSSPTAPPAPGPGPMPTSTASPLSQGISSFLSSPLPKQSLTLDGGALGLARLALSGGKAATTQH